MIPKIIHYIWLGNNSKSSLIHICINSWKEKLPDYEIKEWNENAIDVDRIAKENKFFAECYKRKLWAYMADYLRLKILYDEGGIYFDTDVQVLKDLLPLLSNECFIGYESNNYIGTGVIAAEKHSSAIKSFLDFYNTDIWNCELFTIPHIITEVVKKRADLNITIYPKYYFAPYNPYTGYREGDIKTDSYCIHWYNAGWTDNPNVRNFLEVKHIHNPIRKIWVIFRKNIRFYLRKVLSKGKKI